METVVLTAKLLRQKPALVTWATTLLNKVHWQAGPHLAKLLAGAGLKKTECVILLLQNDALIGFCALVDQDIVLDTDYAPFVSSVYVDPAFRGQGLSMTLVGLAEQRAQAGGATALYIVTQHTGLYEHRGFKQIGVGKDIFDRPMRLLAKKLG
ncbi:GNAT family N-acetyltransferase [Lacticaseibacillus yichunensis]|uniref:GNAT family N-acetyltransferase n=1 Tax=Lacticaseibacillus yichunensis TaxID=2486015 RepID=A0ABW4CNF5_9LACO|nr:GNAT family N-acetyltransferase [Lacticaseibacillus yichunensis]